MRYILTLSGSPSPISRSTSLLAAAESWFATHDFNTRRIDIAKLPSHALINADFSHPEIIHASRLVAQAEAIIVATPIYQASFAGILKTFLDLLPQQALQHKPVLVIATGGSLAHLLAIDYSLRPVLAALGTRHQLATVYATDAQLTRHDDHYLADDDTLNRLHSGLAELLAHLQFQTIPSTVLAA